ARAQGAEIVVAVGGDGTSNEVINGLMAYANGGQAGTMACIHAGSGNDFAAGNGVPEDVEAACRLIAQGHTRNVDVGLLTLDGSQSLYFGNTFGMGFDGLVTTEVRKNQRARGMALYLPAVLRTIFLTMTPMQVELEVDGAKRSCESLMMTVANGPREGHTFFVAPNARSNDGLLDMIVVGNMSKLGMLVLLPRVMAGTHLSHPRVSEIKARHIVVRSERPMALHMDGETPRPSVRTVDVQVVPGVLRLIAPPPAS
ncbi:MAG: YegS/Rv2252/BmrU family lipid kinase, partial [Chloroflexota bacterium]